jgi:hypothetical protein
LKIGYGNNLGDLSFTPWQLNLYQVKNNGKISTLARFSTGMDMNIQHTKPHLPANLINMAKLAWFGLLQGVHPMVSPLPPAPHPPT